MYVEITHTALGMHKGGGGGGRGGGGESLTKLCCP